MVHKNIKEKCNLLSQQTVKAFSDIVLGMSYIAYEDGKLKERSVDTAMFDNLTKDVVAELYTNNVVRTGVANGTLGIDHLLALIGSRLLDSHIKIIEDTISKFPAGSDEEHFYSMMQMMLVGKRNALVLNGPMQGLEERISSAFKFVLLVYNAMQFQDVMSALSYISKGALEVDRNISAIADKRLSNILDDMGWDGESAEHLFGLKRKGRSEDNSSLYQ